ncbi:MAG: NAD(P)-dependent oxidoreductase [Planctomycetota bacterium]
MTVRFKVVLIANDDHPIPEWVSKKFEQTDIDFVYHQCYGREDLEKCATDADVLWLMSSRKGLVLEENMYIFKNARAIIKCGSGTDNIDHDACTKRGIIVAHTPDDPTDCTSDHFIAMLFTAVRQTARQDRLVRRGIWSVHAAMPIGPLTGADLGLIGFGRIGKMIALKLSGFRMNIRVFDPFVDSATIEAAGCVKMELAQLLKESQYVLLACLLTEETRGILGEKELKQMRSDAVLVNVARAGLVDEKALIKALRENWFKAAAFDVLESHPLQPGDEFLELENINFTPHLGGYAYNYPNSLFITCVNEIIGMSKMQLPKWIANKGVVLKRNIT